MCNKIYQYTEGTISGIYVPILLTKSKQHESLREENQIYQIFSYYSQNLVQYSNLCKVQFG